METTYELELVGRFVFDFHCCFDGRFVNFPNAVF